MLIKRILLEKLCQALTPGKVIVLYGPRQAGKTTLVTELASQLTQRCLMINADEQVYRDALSSQDSRILGELIGEHEVVIIDEAQRVTNIGLNLKIMVDRYPQTAIIATGSASFDLANKICEPLTGRKLTYTLFPVSFAEIAAMEGMFAAKQQLERLLVWGGYPAIITPESAASRERLLNELVGSYLYRDLWMFNGIRRSEKIVDLLRLLALQIGQEVSIAELATSLAMHRNTVERYLDLLEKTFVIFKRSGFSRNLRNEICKNDRYYFLDNGVRNSLIQNYNPLHLRPDVGQLWENFLMVERLKANSYSERAVNSYFWRTYDQKEIDLIEERGGQLLGFEFKWQRKPRQSNLQTFTNAYPGAHVQTMTSENYVDFIS